MSAVVHSMGERTLVVIGAAWRKGSQQPLSWILVERLLRMNLEKEHCGYDLGILNS